MLCAWDLPQVLPGVLSCVCSMVPAMACCPTCMKLCPTSVPEWALILDSLQACYCVGGTKTSRPDWDPLLPLPRFPGVLFCFLFLRGVVFGPSGWFRCPLLGTIPSWTFCFYLEPNLSVFNLLSDFCKQAHAAANQLTLQISSQLYRKLGQVLYGSLSLTVWKQAPSCDFLSYLYWSCAPTLCKNRGWSVKVWGKTVSYLT